MWKTTRILLPFVLLSLNILGLATIYNGGLLDIQWGDHKRLRIEGSSSAMDIEIDTDDVANGSKSEDHKVSKATLSTR